jgi:hypothetical protein
VIPPEAGGRPVLAGAVGEEAAAPDVVPVARARPVARRALDRQAAELAAPVVVEADTPLRVVGARAPAVERQDGGGEEESGQSGEGFHVGLLLLQ